VQVAATCGAAWGGRDESMVLQARGAASGPACCLGHAQQSPASLRMCVVTVTDAAPAPPSAPHRAPRNAGRGRGEKCAACDYAHRLFAAGVTAVWRGDSSRTVFACVAQSICVLGFHALDRGAVGTHGGTCGRSTPLFLRCCETAWGPRGAVRGRAGLGWCGLACFCRVAM